MMQGHQASHLDYWDVGLAITIASVLDIIHKLLHSWLHDYIGSITTLFFKLLVFIPQEVHFPFILL